MGNPGNQINYNSPCLDVTKTNDGFKTTRGKEGLDFDKLMKCFPEDFKNLNLNDLDKALKEYMTRPEISQEARETINLILNEFIRKIGDYKKTLSLYRQEGRPFTKERTITIDLSKRKEQEHTEQIDRLGQKHTKELQKLIQKHKEELDRLGQKHTKELGRLRQEHSSTKQELTKKTNSVNKQAKIIQNIRKTRDELQKELDKLRQEHALTTQELIKKTNLVSRQKEQIQNFSQKLIELEKELNELRTQPSQPTPPPSPRRENILGQEVNQPIASFPNPDNPDFLSEPAPAPPPENNNFGGGARRTKKRRRRSNKTKLGRRLQNRISRRKTLRKRSKN
jgi:myosin heavy subunit